MRAWNKKIIQKKKTTGFSFLLLHGRLNRMKYTNELNLKLFKKCYLPYN